MTHTARTVGLVILGNLLLCIFLVSAKRLTYTEEISCILVYIIHN